MIHDTIFIVSSAIDGKVITWIESKATFGDEETHQNYVKDQLTSYYNRYVSLLND